jgi:hypothetical protein
MRYQPTNLEHKPGLAGAPWSPKIIAEMDDYPCKLVRVDGEAKMMLIEPRGVVTTRATGGELTAPGEQWV